jgi:5-methylcytosine-specific restriction protein B
MILADQIRQYVLKNYIEPARQRGDSTVHVKASAVHSALGLQSRFPAICSALDSDKFLEYARVTLVNRSGPKQSSSVEWIFAVK